MKILLDTQIALWWVSEHENLSPKVKAILLDDENALFLSIVSIWEIAIKSSIGKLPNFTNGVSAFMANVENMPIELLPITPTHAEAVERLPFIHRDHFDRMLVATAIIEGLIILSTDEDIRKYNVPSIW